MEKTSESVNGPSSEMKSAPVIRPRSERKSIYANKTVAERKSASNRGENAALGTNQQIPKPSYYEPSTSNQATQMSFLSLPFLNRQITTLTPELEAEDATKLSETSDEEAKEPEGHCRNEQSCSVCQAQERKWKEFRNVKKVGVPTTEKDMHEFHAHMVRTGGMRQLVDQMKLLCDPEVPPNRLMPMFMASLMKPHERMGIEGKIKVMKFLERVKNHLDNINQELDKQEEGVEPVEPGAAEFKNRSICLHCGDHCDGVFK